MTKNNIFEITNFRLPDKKEIRIFNIPICQFGYKMKNSKKKIFFKIFPKFGFREKFFEEAIKLDSKCTDFYITKQASGEPYLLTYLIEDLIKKDNAQNPMVIGIKKYHKDIFYMFANNIKCDIVPTIGYNAIQMFPKKEYTYKKRKFHIYLPSFFFENFYKEVNKNSDKHYFLEIMNFLGLKPKDKHEYSKNVHIESDKYDNLQQKIQNSGLNENNFIYIAPEATACKDYDEDFWIELITELKNAGFDVYLNTIKKYKHLSNIAKIFDTDFQEAYILASKSKGIVALRCGMIEMFTTLNKKMNILYTGYNKRDTSTDEVMSSNSLTKLPNTKASINEYNTDLIKKEELLNQIMANLLEAQ